MPSPERESWAQDVLEALEADTGALHDDTDGYRPGDLDLEVRDTTETDEDAYKRLA